MAEQDSLPTELQNLIVARQLYRVTVAESYSPVPYSVNTIVGFGCALQGYVATTFDQLRETFGNPIRYRDPAVEWVVDFEDGRMATIFLHRVVAIPQSLYLWPVGARRVLDVERVAAALGTNYYVHWDRSDESDEVSF
jgi:hypothetical protein